MKWIKVQEGHWRMVSDDYNAPEDAPPSKPGVPNFITRPPWATFEKDAHASDTDTQVKATDAFLDDRKKWTSPGGKWSNWEAGRKQELAKNKPLWRKQRMKEDPLLSA